jgi:hypothetical protein
MFAGKARRNIDRGRRARRHVLLCATDVYKECAPHRVSSAGRSGNRIGKGVAVILVAPIQAGEVFLDHDLK